MDPISKLAQSLALLRRQAPGKGPGAPASAGPAAGGASGARPSRGTAPAPGELRKRVLAGLCALPEAERGSLERQASVFVEQVLLHEWGTPFRQSPQFRQTVKRVVRAMDSDPQVRAELKALLQELASDARK